MEEEEMNNESQSNITRGTTTDLYFREHDIEEIFNTTLVGLSDDDMFIELKNLLDKSINRFSDIYIKFNSILTTLSNKISLKYPKCTSIECKKSMQSDIPESNMINTSHLPTIDNKLKMYKLLEQLEDNLNNINSVNDYVLQNKYAAILFNPNATDEEISSLPSLGGFHISGLGNDSPTKQNINGVIIYYLHLYTLYLSEYEELVHIFETDINKNYVLDIFNITVDSNLFDKENLDEPIKLKWWIILIIILGSLLVFIIIGWTINVIMLKNKIIETNEKFTTPVRK